MRVQVETEFAQVLRPLGGITERRSVAYAAFGIATKIVGRETVNADSLGISFHRKYERLPYKALKLTVVNLLCLPSRIRVVMKSVRVLDQVSEFLSGGRIQNLLR